MSSWADSSFESFESVNSKIRLKNVPILRKKQNEEVDQPFLLSSAQPPSRVESNMVVDQDDIQTITAHQTTTNYFAYFIFFLLGVGMLFPWNIFINCRDYFVFRLASSPFADNFDHYFSNAYTLLNVIMLIYLHFVQGNPVQRMVFALITNSIVFAICVICTFIPVFNGSMFFLLNVFLVALSGISTALLQNGAFGIASLFPTIYMQAVMSGQGLAGAAVSLSHILSIAVSNGGSENDLKDPSFSSFLYFSFALMVIIVCFVGVFYLKSLDIYKHFVIGHHSESPILTFTDKSPQLASEITTKENKRDKGTTRRVFVKILPMALAVYLVFFMTLSVFPPLIGLIESVNESSLFDRVYFNPTTFLVFALGDWFGKSLPGFALSIPLTRIKIEFSRPSCALWILCLALLRILFVPLVLICNIVLRDPQTGTVLPKTVPTLINTDLGYFALLIALAVTNGWLGSLAMMHGPQMVAKKRLVESGDGYEQIAQDEDESVIAQEKQTAGILMVFSLTLGLASGSWFSFVLRSAICGWCNPFVH